MEALRNQKGTLHRQQYKQESAKVDLEGNQNCYCVTWWYNGMHRGVTEYVEKLWYMHRGVSHC